MGGIPRFVSLVCFNMESDAGALVRRPALKTGFSEMGWGSTPLSSAKLEIGQDGNAADC